MWSSRQFFNQTMYTNKEDFIAALKDTPAQALMETWLDNPLPHVFSNEAGKNQFFTKISNDWPEISVIQCAGTANWKYSLNPNKGFRPFSEHSDIDVISISEELFDETWERMREVQRSRWYELPYRERINLRRNGENIYSGFACPKWIPSQTDTFRFKFTTSLDTYSVAEVGFRPVNMYFFKNRDEVIDYYRRGIEAAQRNLK